MNSETKMNSTQTKTRKEIKAILFDMDGTLLDTEALSDKAVLMAFGPDALPSDVFEVEPMCNGRLPWALKKRILGLRGKEWIPIVRSYAIQHWNAKEDLIPPE